MRVRTLVVLAFGVLAVGLIVWSFYANVVASQTGDETARDGAGTEASTAQAWSSPAVSTSPDTRKMGLPGSLGGIPLTGFQSGKEAKAAVEALHDEKVGPGLAAAWVGYYGHAGEATLWISRSMDESSARVLFTRMTDKISQDETPFTGLTALTGSALGAYQLEGFGQKHFYFVVGTEVYWLAADPEIAGQAFSELALKTTSMATETSPT